MCYRRRPRCCRARAAVLRCRIGSTHLFPDGSVSAGSVEDRLATVAASPAETLVGDLSGA
jgi:hypothetical protein